MMETYFQIVRITQNTEYNRNAKCVRDKGKIVLHLLLSLF